MLFFQHVLVISIHLTEFVLVKENLEKINKIEVIIIKLYLMFWQNIKHVLLTS